MLPPAPAIRRPALLLAVAAVLAACGPTNTPPGPDAAADVTVDAPPDAAPDVASDVARDVPGPDAAPDVARDVPAPDAAPDVARDVPAPDAAPDAAPDVARDVPAPDVARDVPAMDAPPACRGDAPSCVQGTAGGQCSDALTVARCEGGAWRCGVGEVFVSECRCLGRPPGSGCTCGSSGWVCPDAGAMCTGRPASCVTGTAGGLCGDVVTAPMCVAGAWTCPSGSVFTTQCACVGRPPGSGCTCGASGWVCPDAGADASADGGAAGTLCAGHADCASGLLCCYPCGIPGCMNRCMAPMGGRCPLIP